MSADHAAAVSLRVGNMPTMNQDDYPSLGAWWLNIWQGEGDDAVVIARAYGSTSCGAPNCGLLSQEPDDGA